MKELFESVLAKFERDMPIALAKLGDMRELWDFEHPGEENRNPYQAKAKRLNSALPTMKKELRLLVLAKMFDRHFPIASSYDLRVCEVNTILALARDHDGNLQPDFTAYVKEIANAISD